MRTLLGSAAILTLLATPAAPRSQTLMSCEIQQVRSSGENTEIVYSHNCRPVTNAEVLRTETGPNGEIRIIYGRERPALGGGPIYIMRHGDTGRERGTAHYGAPLDGNVGTVGR
jgi:hypothetical protein